MMKNISTKQAPKGRMPPSRQVMAGFRYLAVLVVVVVVVAWK